MAKQFKYGKEHLTPDMKIDPVKYIPKGHRCFSRGKDNQVIMCPFYDIDLNMPEKFNGYCHFLQLGDWELGLEVSETMVLTGIPLLEAEGKTPYELFMMESPISCPNWELSKLWKERKECGVNEDNIKNGEGN